MLAALMRNMCCLAQKATVTNVLTVLIVLIAFDRFTDVPLAWTL